jgi:hypothetical protein
MKTKIAFFILLPSMAAAVLWGTWSLAYHRGFDRGYSQGGRDEFVRWKQEPTPLSSGVAVGRRNMLAADAHAARPIITTGSPTSPVNGVSSIYPTPKQ